MLLREFVLHRLDHPRRGNRSGDEGDADRCEFLWRQCLCREPGPETVTVAGNRGEAGDTFARDEVVDLAAFDECARVITAAEAGVARAWPGFGDAARQILRIGAHLERAGRIAPDFPGRARGLEPIEEPGLLRRAEYTLRRFVFLEIGNLGVAEADRRGRVAAAVAASGVE